MTLTNEELTEAFEYLDELRESGRTHMFGAPAYLVSDLGWDKRDAGEATKLWMDTFGRDLSVEQRVAKAVTA